ncbi:MAG: oligosaccharide flippase family protein [Candidatus Andersenbacteria bacterium]
MSLARIQFLSLFTKAITTALGIGQSIIIVRLLSPEQFGLVGLVMSIGGVIGVSQHLGIVDGAIREIAILKSKQEIGKIFWASQITRQLVTVPLSLGLLALANLIAVSIYGKPEITPYLQLFAAVLVLQGLQDVLGATLTGMKKFYSLYLVQILTAAINIVVFGLFILFLGTQGFFYAVIVTTVIMVVLLGIIVRRNLRQALAFPSWSELLRYSRRVMKIGAFMYLARIFFVVWQRLPLLALGGVLASDQLGYLNVSLTFGARLTIIAMALSEVNLSWMSSLYAGQIEQFKHVVTRNMRRVFMLMTTLTLLLLFFTPEILTYIIGVNYLPAEPLIYIMTLAFFLYSLLDIGTSSVFVAADKPHVRAGIYGLLTAVSAATMGWLYLVYPDPLWAAVAVFSGAAVAYLAMVVIARRYYGIRLLTNKLALLLGILGIAVIWLLSGPGLGIRIGVLVLLLLYSIREVRRSNLLPAAFTRRSRTAVLVKNSFQVVCFAGAAYDQPSWTNRQHMMSRVAQRYPVLYVEPRIWILRFLLNNWRQPHSIFKLLTRIFWLEKKSNYLYIKSQWNLLPGSREIKWIATINHWLNRPSVLLCLRLLHFKKAATLVWIYDTEAAEYLSAFRTAKVIYDCVDDHAAQAGVDRNPKRVVEEEHAIIQRADLVTVTSKKLLTLKQQQHTNIHLVLNAGDVKAFFNLSAATAPAPIQARLATIPHPIFGSVGALDSYKIDFDLLYTVATRRAAWQFIFIGEPIVDRSPEILAKIKSLPNIHLIGPVKRQVVPSYVANFDICIIPYRLSRYNEASFPLKFWEFMATGKPLLVTGLPELKEYSQDIGYATNPEEFIQQGEQFLKNPQHRKVERIAQAHHHSWEDRVERILTLINNLWN